MAPLFFVAAPSPAWASVAAGERGNFPVCRQGAAGGAIFAAYRDLNVVLFRRQAGMTLA
jgi:hypothetical protein